MKQSKLLISIQRFKKLYLNIVKSSNRLSWMYEVVNMLLLTFKALSFALSVKPLLVGPSVLGSVRHPAHNGAVMSFLCEMDHNCSHHWETHAHNFTCIHFLHTKASMTLGNTQSPYTVKLFSLSRQSNTDYRVISSHK